MNGFQVIEGDFDVHYYPISPSNTAIGEGDMLEFRDDGYVWPAQVSTVTPIGIASCAIAANTGGTVPVIDNPNIVFRGQSDDASIDAQTDFGLAYNIVANTPTLGKSNMLIDGSSGATTATLPIKILRVSTIINQDGNVLGSGVILDCQFNQHFLKAGSVGI